MMTQANEMLIQKLQIEDPPPFLLPSLDPPIDSSYVWEQQPVRRVLLVFEQFHSLVSELLLHWVSLVQLHWTVSQMGVILDPKHKTSLHGQVSRSARWRCLTDRVSLSLSACLHDDTLHLSVTPHGLCGQKSSPT